LSCCPAVRLPPCFVAVAFLASRNKLVDRRQLFDDGSGFIRTYVTHSRCPAACLSLCFILAAFLASRNKPSVDKQLFDDGSGFKRRSGMRRRNVMGASRQVRGLPAGYGVVSLMHCLVISWRLLHYAIYSTKCAISIESASWCKFPVLQAEAAKAAELKGPHSFSFARLMAVYANLLSADENHTAAAGSSGTGSSLAAQQLQQMRGEAAAECGGAAAAMGGGWLGVQSADVMMGVKNLVAARLLTQVGYSCVVTHAAPTAGGCAAADTGRL
jgi:hypothetical protein